MFKKIQSILTYHDSEPIEIILGLNWMIVFPMIWFFENGICLWLQIPSFILGLAGLKSVCYHNLRIRKAISYGIFLFSWLIALISIIKFNIVINPVQSIWILTAIMASFSLKNISKKYYILNNGNIR
jgi:hypothetical protein